MATIVDIEKLPPGWVLGLKWKTWVGGILVSHLPFANNVYNRKFIKQGVSTAQWTKGYFALGMKSTDVSYNASDKSISFSTSTAVAKGWGYDTLGEACGKIREVLQADGSGDVGDLTNLKVWQQHFATMTTT